MTNKSRIKDLPDGSSEYDLGFVRGQLLALDVASSITHDDLSVMRGIATDMMGHDLTPACHGILRGHVFALTKAMDMSVVEMRVWHGRILESLGDHITRTRMGEASSDDE